MLLYYDSHNWFYHHQVIQSEDCTFFICCWTILCSAVCHCFINSTMLKLLLKSMQIICCQSTCCCQTMVLINHGQQELRKCICYPQGHSADIRYYINANNGYIGCTLYLLVTNVECSLSIRMRKWCSVTFAEMLQ